MSVRAGREFLAIPGPTTVPDEVLRAMHRPAVDIYSGPLLALTDGLLRDVARVELGAKNQDINCKVNGIPSASLAIFQLPDANALDVADDIKAKMKETGALLAGEMSGHTFFAERWYGFDDALYTGARLLEILSKDADASAVLRALPDSLSTPELNVAVADASAHAMIAHLAERASFPGAADIIRIDGLRVEYSDGFGLARASNTTPVIVLRFEASDAKALARIQGEFRRVFNESLPGQALPF